MTDTNANTNTNNINNNPQPLFGIEKLYVKDLSVEVPHAPEIFLAKDAPQVNIRLGTEAKNVEQDIFEVSLNVSVSAILPKTKEQPEEVNVFLVEVNQAGIFRVVNIPSEQLDPLLAIACPTVLFPYAREVISEATSKAGFPPVILQPVNFEALYLQKLQEEQNQQNQQK